MATKPPTAADLGITRVGTEIKRQLTFTASGEEKEGKTHFCLTMPSPILIIDMDIGTKGVVEKFAGDKQIDRKRIELPDLPFPKPDAEKVRQLYDDYWDMFVTTYHFGLRNYRSMIIDTMTEAYELIRLARFGKLTQVMPVHYASVNAEFAGLLNAASNSDCNVGYIHRYRDEYVNEKKTGGRETSGWKDIAYKVDMNIVSFRDADGFHVRVTNCRQNSDMAGQVYDEPMNTFPFLAAEAYPSTEMTDWE